MYKLQLLKAINNYDGSDSTFENIKNVICEISDNENLINEPLMRELLFIGSEKMRTFGYNKMNNIELGEITLNFNNLPRLSSFSIDELYTSDTGILLDKKQSEIIDTFINLETKRMIVSAPTSFGKTFILREIIFFNKDLYNNILLILPTVSLINENTEVFLSFIDKLNLNYNIINSTHSDIDISGKNLFILTPERILKLLDTYPTIKIDFFFMDEIYKIDNFFNIQDNEDSLAENERDKVFRIVLYLLAKEVNHYYLAGPYLDLSNLGIGFNNFILKNNVTLIDVKTELVKQLHVPAWKTKINFGEYSYSYSGMSKIQKTIELLNFININNLGPTIVYGESKSKITLLANEYTENSNLSRQSENNAVNRFVNHLTNRYSTTIKNIKTHLFWTLIHALKIGVGIHHGAFPKYIQKEILDLFNNGYLRVLFSTTSITEGVNTKAKNIIFYGKRKGTKPLKCFDVKNINGRAGRYYHYFIGRIFYLEPSIYELINKHDDSLDFITYSEKPLSEVDYDNSNLSDLSLNNAMIKKEKDLLIASYGIDEEVFIKNRLLDRYKQIELIELLSKEPKNKLQEIVEYCSSIGSFLKNNTIYQILLYFKEINLLDEHDAIKFGKISTDYSKSDGIFLLLNYHLKDVDEFNAKIIDKAYMNVFSDIRNIVEYKVPKFLTIFESILKYVCSLPEIKIDTENMKFDSIIRFYELGVETQIGTFLAEKGYPISTIKVLEKFFKPNMDFSHEQFKILVKENELNIKNKLDDYEMNLLKLILKLN